MLKQQASLVIERDLVQPPSGGCVLKPYYDLSAKIEVGTQPPSGGCVLKPVSEAGNPVKISSRLQAAVC